MTGCAPAESLRALGAAAAAPGRALFDAHPGEDAFWVTALVTALGEIEAADRSEWLLARLGDHRWEVRARAALALGAHHAAASQADLERVLGGLAPGRDPGVEAALCYALDRGADARNSPWRRRFVALLGDDASTHPPVFLPFLAELVGTWKTHEALPAVRPLLRHPSPFVRLEALRAVAKLRDTGSVAAAVGLLDDPNPGVRDAAPAALGRITGQREPRDAAGWKAWCEARSCRRPGPP